MKLLDDHYHWIEAICVRVLIIKINKFKPKIIILSTSIEIFSFCFRLFLIHFIIFSPIQTSNVIFRHWSAQHRRVLMTEIDATRVIIIYGWIFFFSFFGRIRSDIICSQINFPYKHTQHTISESDWLIRVNNECFLGCRGDMVRKRQST